MFKRLSLLVLALILCLCFCASSLGEEVDLSELNYDDYFTSRDLNGEWDEANATAIELTGSLTINAPGVYVLSGSIADGMVTVNVSSDDKVQLVLNGVTIASSSSPCICVENADKTFITLADGTVNTLISSGFTENDEADGAIFSRDDIVFNGTGTLNITSAKHGIAGNDDVKFGNGTYIIHAGERGITAKDSVRIFTGSYAVYAGKSPIRAKNKKNEDGKGYVLILGGSFYLHTTASEDND